MMLAFVQQVRRLALHVRLMAVVVFAFGLGPSSAWAQSDTDAAVAFSRDAAAAYAAGELVEAAALYERAFALVEDPAFAYNLGAIYDELGDLARAYRYFGLYVELFPGADDRADIEAYLAELLPQVERTYARLVVTSAPSGADVLRIVDGAEQRLGRTPLDLWLDAGDLSLVLRRQGYLDEPLELRGVAGVRVSRDVTLEPIPEPAVVTSVDPDPEPVVVPELVPPPPGVADEGPMPLTRVQRTGLVLGGTGVGVVALGVAMGALGQAAQSDHNELVAGISPTNPGDADEIDRLAAQTRTYKMVGNVAMGLGAATAVTGLVLFFTGRADDPVVQALGVSPMGQRAWGITVSLSPGRRVAR